MADTNLCAMPWKTRWSGAGSTDWWPSKWPAAKEDDQEWNNDLSVSVHSLRDWSPASSFMDNLVLQPWASKGVDNEIEDVSRSAGAHSKRCALENMPRNGTATPRAVGTPLDWTRPPQ